MVYDKKGYPYLICYLEIRPESQSACLPYSGVRRPCRLPRQPINIPGRVEELKSAATSLNLIKRG